jgi:hypothetical protein
MKGTCGRAVVLATVALIASSCAALQQAQSQASPSLPPSPAESPSPLPSPVALKITSAAFHSGEVGATYAPVALGAVGGVGPYTWSISAGALPGGLNLSSDGSVAGAPTAAGTFHFTARVADSLGGSAAVARTVGVSRALKVSLVPACATQCSVEIGCVTVCGRFGTVTGGSPPYRYALAAGYIPTGTSLSALSLAGTFGGSPSRYLFTVAVTDALGVTRTIAPTFYVFPHIAFSGTASCLGDYNTPCSVKIRYSGGTPGALPKVGILGYGRICPNLTFCYPTPTSLPPTFQATVGGGYVTVSVDKACGYPGVAGCPAGWYGLVYLNLTDKSLCKAGAYCKSSGSENVTVEIAGG